MYEDRSVSTGGRAAGGASAGGTGSVRALPGAGSLRANCGGVGDEGTAGVARGARRWGGDEACGGGDGGAAGGELSDGLERGASRATSDLVGSVSSEFSSLSARISGGDIHSAPMWTRSDRANAAQITRTVMTSCRLPGQLRQSFMV